ncbi:hypothetical protein HK098_001469 [Nowakowskiella sp. JEL0407]|nr:hypothetical protein HK098_001469 [Nowakowskiella sp. JEL0407]
MPIGESSRFLLPSISFNSDGWGPTPESDELTDVPYAPFSKSDRLGKIADWTSPSDSSAQGATVSSSSTRSKFKNATGNVDSYGSGTAERFLYTHAAEEEASFSVVDRVAGPPKPRPYGSSRTTRGGRVGTQVSQRTDGKTSTATRGRAVGQSGRGGMSNIRRNVGGKWGYSEKPTRLRDASITVQPDWTMLEEIEFNKLNKVSFDAGNPTDLAFHGTLNYVNKDFDRLTVKQEKILQQFEKTFFNVTTAEDPVLMKISKKITKPAVFVTDKILATLMCATRSVYPWDVVITKEGEKLYIDKRPDSLFDFVTVNENAIEPPVEGTEKESINSPGSLAQEGTEINRNFSQQVLRESETCEFAKENPFYDPAQDPFPPAPALYRYRQWEMGEDFTLVVRTQLDAAVLQPKNPALLKQDRTSIAEALEDSKHPLSDTMFATVHALNEFDPKAVGAGGAPEWRQKLDAQRGAVMASEIKNNANKLAKWTVESILAGADQLRIGFISRTQPKDRNRHSILGVGFYKPHDFAVQMNYNIKNGWGIFKTIVDLCMDMEDGKFVLARDPNKPIIRLYQVPDNTFEDEEFDA